MKTYGLIIFFVLCAFSRLLASAPQSYYAPPNDWVPEKEISDYSMNTRVPDLARIRYDGAYALGLRIRPLTADRIQKQAAADLISRTRLDNALSFRLSSEQDPANRRIVLRNLRLPKDLTEFSFKMKSMAKNAGEGLKVAWNGKLLLDTAKDADSATRCLDGFRAYRVALPSWMDQKPGELSITVDPAYSSDFQQEFFLMDLMFRRKNPLPRFHEIPPRRWIRKSQFESGKEITEQDAVPDIVTFVRTAKENGLESRKLPFHYELRPQADKDRDGGFRTELRKETVDGRSLDVLRITLENGPRCYLKFPVAFDGTDFNTMTFYAKVEVSGIPEGKRFLGNGKPSLFGADAAAINSPPDTFGFGAVSSTHDLEDWPRYGVTQGTFGWHRREPSFPDGWRAVALDLVNDDYAGTKSTFHSKITHWCFYYGNAKLPPGAKVTVSIADPRITRGMMLAGGDMERYRKFLRNRQRFTECPILPGKADETDPAGRLDGSLPWIAAGLPQGEIILSGKEHGKQYGIIVRHALDAMNSVFVRQYGLSGTFPVLDAPSEKNHTKLFIGGDAYAKINPEQYAADLKFLAGSSGCAIRTHGKHIYIYAAGNGYSGDARGLANGIYTFLEHNTGAIAASFWKRNWKTGCDYVTEKVPSGNLNLVWGNNYRNRPPFLVWGFSGDPDWNDFNRAAFHTVWGNWRYGGSRAWATNHCWSYGTGKTADATWGIGEDGKRMKPGCYTGHPCLINVLEPAKLAYFDLATRKNDRDGQLERGKAYIYNTNDVLGMWVEDTLKVCRCEACATPIRLPDGTLLRHGEPDFLSTQFYQNSSAMLHFLNVHVRRDIKVESIAYFWMAIPPRMELSRNYKIRFCPYIRKNYFVPIYAPSNDVFWRALSLWKQTETELGLYEYFLDMNFRPWSDVFQSDLEAVRECGISDVILESDAGIACSMERWVVGRMMWEPHRSPPELRREFLNRTWREAARDMEKFFSLFYRTVYRDFAPYQPMEFEDRQQLGVLILRTKTPEGVSVEEAMEQHLRDAEKNVRNPDSKQLLGEFRSVWDAYRKKARLNSKADQKQ